MKGNGHLFAFDLNDALSIQEILLLYVMCLLCSFNYGGFLNRMGALTLVHTYTLRLWHCMRLFVEQSCQVQRKQRIRIVEWKKKLLVWKYSKNCCKFELGHWTEKYGNSQTWYVWEKVILHNHNQFFFNLVRGKFQRRFIRKAWIRPKSENGEVK